MHVLYFHQYFSTPANADGTRSYEFARRLIARGHRVTMVCGKHKNTDLGLPGTEDATTRTGTIDGIEVVQFNLPYSNHMSLPKRATVFLRYAMRSVMFAMRADYDLLFATSTPLTAGIPGIFAKYLRRKPFVFEVRDLWPELPRAMGVVKNPLVLAGMSILEKISYRAATGCIALAPGIQEGIVKRSPKNRRIVMIPNGCDLELFRPGNRQELDLPFIKPTDCVAIYTGAHGIANGLDAVLDAAQVLLQRNRDDIAILFIGDGKLKPILMARAQKDQLTNCHFIDPMPKTELSRLVNRCDIGLMILNDVPAFYYGTSPNKFFDYISSGLPVLNNYPGWLADLIDEHQCGAAIPPSDANIFAAALCHLADSPNSRLTRGQNARRLAEEAFARVDLAEHFVDWLELSLSNSQKGN